jgi:hypothetical protein
MALQDQRGNFLHPHNIGAFAYEYDWFSGSQIGVMIGDVLIDGAVAISFNVEQTKTPVYGYANQYYTFLADGHVLVQGVLTIAFKEAGYLLWPIKRFQEKVAAINASKDVDAEESRLNWTSPRYSVDSQGKKVNSYNPKQDGFTLSGAANAAKRKQVIEANVEQMFGWQETADQTRQNRNFNRFWQELGALPDDAFEDWAEAFEDAIWFGSDVANPTVRDKLFSRNLPNDKRISDESVLRHRRADQYPKTDIWIVYGDMSRHPANHTVKKLLDLSFTGQSSSIEISGQPVYEQYNFIARNLV